MPSGLPDATELPLISGEQYQAHATSYTNNDAAYQSFGVTGARQLPEVVSISPDQGPAGRKLFVYLNAADGLETSPQYPSIKFGSRRCTGTLTKLGPQSPHGNYALTVDVPPFDSTGSLSTRVALCLDVGDGLDVELPMGFGHYQYTDATAFGMMSSPPSAQRKRRLSGDIHSASKRTSGQNLRNDYEGLSSSPNSAENVSPFGQNPQPAHYAYAQTANRPQSYGGLPPTSQATPRYGVSPQTTASHLNIPGGAYSGFGNFMADRSSAPPTAFHGMSSAPNGMANPALVRTSTLQSQSAGIAAMANSFGTYPPFPSHHRAVLNVDGDLNSMADLWTWTPEELQAQRRLVRFRRTQNNHLVNAAFEPVTPEDHAKAPGNIYVSCILWKDRKQKRDNGKGGEVNVPLPDECYITSVDTIQLLEALVALRFTVEEKNRIRRNLENHKPETVGKTSSNCEEFFRTIMGFPSPKPRNIEKDVKVFKWKTLSEALGKIFAKYVSTVCHLGDLDRTDA